MSKHEFNVFGLPTHELPLFRENTGRDWVDYGYDNLYGDYLRDLYLGSSIQSAVVSGVSEMIYGEGLNATDKEEKPASMAVHRLSTEAREARNATEACSSGVRSPNPPLFVPSLVWIQALSSTVACKVSARLPTMALENCCRAPWCRLGGTTRIE